MGEELLLRCESLPMSYPLALPRFALLPLCLAIAAASPGSSMAQEHSVPEGAEADALVLDTMVVTGTANAEVADGPVQGYRASRSATGTRTDVELMDTPVSVQVVSRELLDDQQALSMNDALKNVSGVYVMQGPDGNTMDAFNIRGFQLDAYGATYLDGVKDFSRAPKETAGLERVEVLKGPAAIMYGRIEPGGMINRVSKKPQLGQFTRLQQQVGTDNLLRTTLDTNGAFNSEQSWLYRVNLAVENADGYKDHTDNQRAYLAPQVSWQISDRSQVRAGLEYQTNERSWASTYGTIGDVNGPVDVDISTNLHDKDDYYEDDSLTWQLSWQHAFNDNWRIQQRLTYVDRSSKAEGSSLSAADLDGNYTRTYWGWEDEQATIASTNIDLIGEFATGSVGHTLLLGVDYYDEAYDSGGWAYGGTPQPSNIHDPNHHDAPYDLDYTVSDYWYDNRNMGAYMQNQMALLDDRLHLLIGARYDEADYTYHYGGSEFNPTDSKLTWRGGALYQLTPMVAVYASYVEGFGKSNYSWGSGEIFDPQTSHQYEIGTKLQLTPDLNLTVAAFELVKDNLTMADPNDITRTILAGEATSKGLELDLVGQLTPNWKMVAAYAYTDVRYTRSDQFQGERLHSIPRHGASLWNTYAFGGSGWEVGAGLSYRSERLGVQRGNQPALYPYTMDAYTLVDLMVGYEFPLRDMTAKAQLNVNNLTDKVYYPATYGRNSRIAQGEPRRVVASLSLSF